MERRRCREGWRTGTNPAIVHLRLVEQPGRDVAHVGFLELVVLAAHFVDADVLEGADNAFYVEAHSDEAVNEIFVVPVIAVSISIAL